MDHYIDITLLPDPEFKATVLMNALYAKLHRALVEQGHGKVGVSFPKFNKTLGNVLRLHGDKNSLENLMKMSWYKGLSDYTQITECLAVPQGAKYRCVQHLRRKSAHNKRKRAVAKGWLTEEEALEKFPDGNDKFFDHPYAQLKSLSTNSVMRIYIKHGELCNEAKQGVFSSYGLSKEANIPWF